MNGADHPETARLARRLSEAESGARSGAPLEDARKQESPAGRGGNAEYYE